jgi:hypothetical protein
VSELVIIGQTPVQAVVDAIYIAARTLDIWECYAHEGRYHFRLAAGVTIALSADSGERIRVEASRRGRPLITMWSFTACQQDRLAGLIRKMSETVPEAV